MRTYALSVGASEAGLRLDQYLTRRLPAGVSRAMIQRAIRDGLVTVGGHSVKVHHKLHQGDRVEARFASLPAPARDRPLAPQDISLDVVYEDADLLVVNKPAGLVTHPAPGHWDGTLVNAILWHLKEGQGAGDGGHGSVQSPTPHAPCPPASVLSIGSIRILQGCCWWRKPSRRTQRCLASSRPGRSAGATLRWWKATFPLMPGR